jgi:ABC-type glycerol-3-phosphate transport system substrate-binding protein
MWVETVPSAKGDAKKQQAAWNFVYYLGSKKGSGTYLNTMKLPSALKDGTDKAKFDAFNSQKQFADTWYKGAKAMSVDEIFISLIDDAANGRKLPKDALDGAAADVTTIIKASKTKWGK